MFNSTADILVESSTSSSNYILNTFDKFKSDSLYTLHNMKRKLDDSIEGMEEMICTFDSCFVNDIRTIYSLYKEEQKKCISLHKNNLSLSSINDMISTEKNLTVRLVDNYNTHRELADKVFKSWLSPMQKVDLLERKMDKDSTFKNRGYYLRSLPYKISTDLFDNINSLGNIDIKSNKKIITLKELNSHLPKYAKSNNMVNDREIKEIEMYIDDTAKMFFKGSLIPVHKLCKVAHKYKKELDVSIGEAMNKSNESVKTITQLCKDIRSELDNKIKFSNGTKEKEKYALEKRNICRWQNNILFKIYFYFQYLMKLYMEGWKRLSFTIGCAVDDVHERVYDIYSPKKNKKHL